jgi:hypothetical protein
VQTDSGLDTETMLNLALAMKAVPRDRIRFVSMPLADVDHQAPGGIGSTVLWDPTVSARLFQALREDKPVDQVAAEASADPTTTASPSAEPAAPTEATPTASKRRARAKVQAPQPSAMSVHTADQSICH